MKDSVKHQVGARLKLFPPQLKAEKAPTRMRDIRVKGHQKNRVATSMLELSKFPFIYKLTT